MEFQNVKMRIIDDGIKMVKVAEVLGISTQALYNKLNGDSEFVLSEMAKLKEFLHLSDADFLSLFFSDDGVRNAKY